MLLLDYFFFYFIFKLYYTTLWEIICFSDLPILKGKLSHFFFAGFGGRMGKLKGCIWELLEFVSRKGEIIAFLFCGLWGENAGVEGWVVGGLLGFFCRVLECFY